MFDSSHIKVSKRTHRKLLREEKYDIWKMKVRRTRDCDFNLTSQFCKNLRCNRQRQFCRGMGYMKFAWMLPI